MSGNGSGRAAEIPGFLRLCLECLSTTYDTLTTGGATTFDTHTPTTPIFLHGWSHDRTHLTVIQDRRTHVITHSVCTHLAATCCPDAVGLALEVLGALKRHHRGHTLLPRPATRASASRPACVHTYGMPAVRAGTRGRTSAYFVEPQHALKAITASLRAMPLMRSIVL